MPKFKFIQHTIVVPDLSGKLHGFLELICAVELGHSQDVLLCKTGIPQTVPSQWLIKMMCYSWGNGNICWYSQV